MRTFGSAPRRALRSLTAAVLPILALASAAPQAAARDNVVLLWNQAALQAIQAARTPPPVAARALAIVHTCMFDAWAAYDDVATGTRFGSSLRRPPSERTLANEDKAISFAGYRALVDLLPSQKMMKFDPLMDELGLDASDNSSDRQTPSGIGNLACRAVLDFRHHDGANQLGDLHPGAYSDYTAFTPANTAEVLSDPNRWQPLVVNGVPQKWLLAHWGMVAPFGAESMAQFREEVLSQGPDRFRTSGYWKQALDVVELSSQLGDRQKVIAEYWADGLTTVTPPGHWNLFAQAVSRRDAHSLQDDVKMFFILNNALMDSSIVAWDVKRCSDSIRPITVVRTLMGNREMRAWAGPGLGVKNIYGRDFRSYIPTPAFGSYVSGHSSLSAAAAEILKRFTGSDHLGESFQAEPGSSLVEPGLTPSAPVILSWETFTEAADQAGMSRRYGGIHFENDDVAGRALGRRVAGVVWTRARTYIDGTAQ